MTKHILFAGLLALGLSPAARADDKPVTVPFEILKSGHMAVEIKVEGKGPYKVIFDTGAPTNLLNNKIAKDAGLLKNQPKPLFTLFGSMGEAKIKTLEVGDQKIENTTAIIMDHPTVDALATMIKEPLYGIVGFPFFARFRTTLDYKAKTMTFVPTSYKPGDTMQAMMRAMLSGPQGPVVLAPAAQWGFHVEKDAKDEDPGVTVKSVQPDSPADKAGLKPGDRLLTLDSRWTDSVPDTFAATSTVKAGTTVVVTVKRGDKEIDLKVTPVSGL